MHLTCLCACAYVFVICVHKLAFTVMHDYKKITTCRLFLFAPLPFLDETLWVKNLCPSWKPFPWMLFRVAFTLLIISISQWKDANFFKIQRGKRKSYHSLIVCVNSSRVYSKFCCNPTWKGSTMDHRSLKSKGLNLFSRKIETILVLTQCSNIWVKTCWDIKLN